MGNQNTSLANKDDNIEVPTKRKVPKRKLPKTPGGANDDEDWGDSDDDWGSDDDEDDNIRFPHQRITQNTGIERFKKKVKDLGPLTPIAPLFHSDKMFDFETHTGQGLSDHDNYGFLPTNVLHHILLHFQPKELVPIFLTCKLVYGVSCTNLWWKSYYQSFFTESAFGRNPFDNKPSKEEEEINWKKMFFNRYYYLTDCYYKTSYSFYMARGLNIEGERRLPVDVFSKDEACVKKYLQSLANVDKRRFKMDSDGKVNIFFSRKDRCDDSEPYQAIVQPRNIQSSKKVGGVVLCFDVSDSSSFEEIKQNLEKIRTHESFEKYTVMILVGYSSIHNERKIEYDAAVDFANQNGLVGYIEWDEERNVFLSLGILLDGILKRSDRKVKEKMDLFFAFPDNVVMK